MVASRDGSEGWAGTVAGYRLLADGVKVASFAEGRIGYREWACRNGRLGEIHSIDDRLNHDVDELIA